MTQQLQQELEDLKKKLLTMASYAETALNTAMRALVERDDELAYRVANEDDLLDDLEIEVDEQSINLLSKAPLATDLRFITVAMKISHDLERVGDEATAISRRVLELNGEPQLKPYLDLPRMADMVLQMLNAALDAFVSRNPTQAAHVIPRDKQVDALNKQLTRELSSFIAENPANISRCLALMMISKRLERIGDHATNIAEEVVYLYEGRDIRHLGKDLSALTQSKA
jgi:phosphate transport system protein